MSGRFWDDYDDDPWRSRLFWVDVQRALKTKPGLRALTELRDALLDLPEKRLALGQACVVPFGEDDEPDLSKPTFCAMGLWLYRKRVAAGEDKTKVIEDLSSPVFSSEDYGPETVEVISHVAKQLGMAKSLSNHIQWINDGDEDLSEEARYEYVLKWVNDQIGRNPHYVQ